MRFPGRLISNDGAAVAGIFEANRAIIEVRRLCIEEGWGHKISVMQVIRQEIDNSRTRWTDILLDGTTPRAGPEIRLAHVNVGPTIDLPACKPKHYSTHSRNFD